jgi:hypothetical protein
MRPLPLPLPLPLLLLLLQERRVLAEAAQAELGPDSLGPETNVATLVQRILKCGVLTRKMVEYRLVCQPDERGRGVVGGRVCCLARPRRSVLLAESALCHVWCTQAEATGLAGAAGSLALSCCDTMRCCCATT